jgi:uncharacterized protein (TIGR02246 family)
MDQTDADTERELIRLERRYWEALKDADAKTAAELSDDPCVIAGAQGAGRLDRASLSKMFATAQWKLESFELTRVEARVLTKDVGVVAYQVREALTVEGKRVDLDAANTSTWVRRDGRWVCAVHTESIAGDPFGRDRARS